METETNKLNWNGLTDKEQDFVETIINRDVLYLCNELVEYASENDDYIDFENVYEEEEDTFKDIFQYFIISEWLYEELSEIGACIAQFKGLYIWGKTDFGQSMQMNHELKKIAKNVIERV
tara:strand:+ start:778 stop:1137 length:360 start_codon:yes stop_codon:yes gene_type:complete